MLLILFFLFLLPDYQDSLYFSRAILLY